MATRPLHLGYGATPRGVRTPTIGVQIFDVDLVSIADPTYGTRPRSGQFPQDSGRNY